MKKLLITVIPLLLLTIIVPAQTDGKNKKQLIGIGIKAGVNFANITKAIEIGSNTRTGFMAGAFLAPASKRIISSRTEILFSKQGYNYKTNTNSGSVDLNYLIIPQLMGINITRFVQLQVGAQMAFLLNAKADSSKPAAPNNPYAPIMDYYNRFDYGAAAGIEIYPVKNVLIGARFNLSFGDLYKNAGDFSGTGSGAPPSFIPKVNTKNNVIQVFAGIRF
ncbi:MAG: PorT family protein [Chitinophagaceae bacterium]|nr:PorT family protein [Chitinophagaceae bacterium]